MTTPTPSRPRVGSRSLGLSALVALTLLACKPDPVVVNPDDGKLVDTAPTETAATWPDEPFRAERPKPREIAAMEIPTIQRFTLDNGLEVFLVQQQTLPTVTMTFEFDTGEVDDPAGKTGVASLCGDLLDEGTKKKDKAALKAALDDHAVRIWTSPGTETTTINVRTLERELPAALDLLAEMILEPGLRAEDFDRLEVQEKNWIEQSKGSPTSLAYRVLPTLIWGANHPYGKIETDKSVDKVSLADCKRWVGKLEPGGARLWMVGRLDEAQIREQLGKRLSKWTGKAPVAKPVAAAEPAKGTIFFVHVDKAAQSQILVGHPGPARDADDYEATQMVAAILGGSFSSRLNMNLREDKGWAYGARGGFSYSRGGSYFSAGSSVRTDATGGALREIAKEIARMRSGEPTADELRREQEGALLAMPAKFATATDALYEFKALAFFGLPLDWHAGYQQRLRALDTKAVAAAAAAHLQDRDQVVLVVGDGAVVLPDLEAIAGEKLFGDGGIVFLDSDGNKVARPTFDARPAE